MSRLDHEIERQRLQDEPTRGMEAFELVMVSSLLLELSRWDAPSILKTPGESPHSFPWLEVPSVSGMLADPRPYLASIRDIGASSEDARVASGALSALAAVAKHIETKVFTARQISDDVLRGLG